MKKYYRNKTMEVLKEIDKHQITLVQAPPGFGKTTAVKQYLNRRGEQHIWIGLKKKTIEEIHMSNIGRNPYVILDHVKKEHFDKGCITRLVQTNTAAHLILISADEVPSFFFERSRSFGNICYRNNTFPFQYQGYQAII